MTIQSATTTAHKKGFPMTFSETEWAYEYKKNGLTLSFAPNGKNEMTNSAVCFGVTNRSGQFFPKNNLAQAIKLFEQWA